MRYLIYATTLWMLSLSLAHVIRQTTRADALAEMIRARCAARSLREIDREARFSAVFHWPNYSFVFQSRCMLPGLKIQQRARRRSWTRFLQNPLFLRPTQHCRVASCRVI
jgi:hypothetical protein